MWKHSAACYAKQETTFCGNKPSNDLHTFSGAIANKQTTSNSHIRTKVAGCVDGHINSFASCRFVLGCSWSQYFLSRKQKIQSLYTLMTFLPWLTAICHAKQWHSEASLVPAYLDSNMPAKNVYTVALLSSLQWGLSAVTLTYITYTITAPQWLFCRCCNVEGN